MLERLYRFHGHNTLTAVYRRGETARSQHVTLKYCSRGADKPFRVAVVVSKKVSKSAVVRNRIRRRIFELVRGQAGTIPAGTDLLFTVFSEQVAEMEGAKLAASITQLLKKATTQQGPTGQNRDIVRSEGKST
jgi:ribonuclease P protein component